MTGTSGPNGGDERAAAAEVVVAGGGLAGLTCAWRAAVAGAEVLVVDDPARPSAANVAAGMIAPVGEASYGEENLLAAGLRAAEEWPAFASELAGAAETEVPYRRCGSLAPGAGPGRGRRAASPG